MIGIVGAGICGLMAARELTARGHRVALWDKARGVGGRMATRRIESAVFDHGAQFFTARSPEFSALLDEFMAADAAREWFRGFPSEEVEKSERHPRFCGVGGMTDVPKFLSRGLDIHLGKAVSCVTRQCGKWQITAGATYEVDSLILTPPVPQSLALLDAGDFQLPDDIRSALECISYEPCWAVLVQLDGPSCVPFSGARQLENGPISWIADNYQKGISPRPGAITIHARGDWSRAHFDDTPEAVIAFLLHEAHDYLGANVIAAQAHRWRFAKPEVLHDAPCLWAQDSGLVFAGDAFGGSKVEGAVLSGLAAARCLNERENHV